jgi:hypothetical protein
MVVAALHAPSGVIQAAAPAAARDMIREDLARLGPLLAA